LFRSHALLQQNSKPYFLPMMRRRFSVAPAARSDAGAEKGKAGAAGAAAAAELPSSTTSGSPRAAVAPHQLKLKHTSRGAIYPRVVAPPPGLAVMSRGRSASVAPSSGAESAVGAALRSSMYTLSTLLRGAPPASAPTRRHLNLNMKFRSTSGACLACLSADPAIYTIDGFLTSAECAAMIAQGGRHLEPSVVVGGSRTLVSRNRTSSSCYLRREDAPFLIERVSRLLCGKATAHMELPQVARYHRGQAYAPHQDSFETSQPGGFKQHRNGGQRIATVLVYLTSAEAGGGCTFFNRLNVRVRPKRGMALVFFPSFEDGFMDRRTIHEAELVLGEKWVTQVWVRQGAFEGLASYEL
jgi:prolyl 4-hydroxylase